MDVKIYNDKYELGKNAAKLGAEKIRAAIAANALSSARVGLIGGRFAGMGDFTVPAEEMKARFNQATLGVYEFGSVFKLFNTAMALENKIC